MGMDMSDNSAPSEGGKKVIILCEKVSKEDIKVRFFDYSGWEEWAEFGASGVHKQYAISLTVPRDSNPHITEPVRVLVELVKPSDDSRSEEEEFFYTPSPSQTRLTGGQVKRENDSTWKQMTNQASGLTSKPRVDPYSKVVLEGNNLSLCGVDYQQHFTDLNGIGGQEFNIPAGGSPYSDSQSPYNTSQPSPDSNGLAALAITGSPQTQPPNVSDSDIVNILGLGASEVNDSDMQNLSDKLGEFSLGAPEAPVSSGRGAAKRSSREAENDSASQLIPRQMERQQSGLHTPNVSSNLSEILQNCKQLNDL